MRQKFRKIEVEVSQNQLEFLTTSHQEKGDADVERDESQMKKKEVEALREKSIMRV